MLVSTAILALCTALVSADLDGETLLQQFYSPGRLLGNSFGNPGLNATYDYVVVGAGLAGSLIASRIAEALPDMTVAVIEAGSFYEISNGNYSQMYVKKDYLEQTHVLTTMAVHITLQCIVEVTLQTTSH